MGFFRPSRFTAAGDPLHPECVRLPQSMRKQVRVIAANDRIGVAEAYRRVILAGLAVRTKAEVGKG